MFNSVAFIKWIFVNIGKSLLKQHNRFKDGLEEETPITLFAWLLISIFTSVLFLIVFGGLSVLIGIHLPIEIWFAYMISCVLYLLYTGTSVMYNKFKSERAELFETIKNGR